MAIANLVRFSALRVWRTFLLNTPTPNHNGRPRDTSIRHAFSRYPYHPYPKSRRLVRRRKRRDPDGEHRLQSISWHSRLEFSRFRRHVFCAPADQRNRSGYVRLLPPHPNIRYPGGRWTLSQGHPRCRVSLFVPKYRSERLIKRSDTMMSGQPPNSLS